MTAIKGILDVMGPALSLHQSKKHLKCKVKVGYQLPDDTLGQAHFLQYATLHHIFHYLQPFFSWNTLEIQKLKTLKHIVQFEASQKWHFQVTGYNWTFVF